jgi:thiamine biosynthesis lipoprotein
MRPEEPPPAEGLRELRFEALGATCHLLGVGVDARRLWRGRAWVEAMHRRLSRFLPGSELSRLNASAGDWARVSTDLEALLRAALDAWRSSGGLVNAAVLEGVLATGYTRPLRLGPTAPGAAGPVAPLPDVLEVRRGRARLRSGAGVDLGGLAKGWMADRLAPWLGSNSLANLGGDLVARGSGPAGDGWPVAVGGVTLLLRDQGAATSSTRRRRWRRDGRLLHHLIDPRTGQPAWSGLSEVSVVAPSALEAEVCAKTALLLGPAAAPAYLAAAAQGWWLA